MRKYLRELEKVITSNQRGAKPVPPTLYNTQYLLGNNIRVPVQRSLYKEGYSFSHLSFADQKKIWLYIWKESDSFFVKSQSLYFLEQYYKEPSEKDWGYLKKYMPQVDNWAYADSLASHYATAHNMYPQTVRPDLTKWHTSNNPWLRRQSLTSIFYYSQLRTPPYPSFSYCKNAITRLIHDEHFYVQKAVGWLLREMYNVYPDKTYRLLEKYAIAIPPAGWQAATEKLPSSDKQKLMAMRKPKILFISAR